MRNYTEEIRAQHDNKIYREVITFSDLNSPPGILVKSARIKGISGGSIPPLAATRRGNKTKRRINTMKIDMYNGDHATDADKIRIFFNDSTCKGLDLQK